MVSYSGLRMGRVPREKRVVKDEVTEDQIWWGDANIPLSTEAYELNR